jgi:AcrR family transcriptional regulator
MADTGSKRKYTMTSRAAAAAATRERLLSAAWARFFERPYDDVRLDDVAADAGVTVRTLHSRFGSKEDLFLAAYQWWAAQEASLRDQVPDGDVAAAVRMLYDSYERIGQSQLRLQAEEERIEAVHRMLEGARAYHREWVARVFAPLLEGLSPAARERRLVALIVATDLTTWKLLRRDMRLERADAERVVSEMVGGPAQQH